MRESLQVSYWDTFHDEAEIQNELTVSSQNREAVKAFFEKREPDFNQLVKSLLNPTIIESNEALVVFG